MTKIEGKIISPCLVFPEFKASGFADFKFSKGKIKVKSQELSSPKSFLDLFLKTVLNTARSHIN